MLTNHERAVLHAITVEAEAAKKRASGNGVAALTIMNTERAIARQKWSATVTLRLVEEALAAAGHRPVDPDDAFAVALDRFADKMIIGAALLGIGDGGAHNVIDDAAASLSRQIAEGKALPGADVDEETA